MGNTAVENARLAQASAPSGVIESVAQRLEQCIVFLTILLAAAVPVWTKAAVLLFRIALVLWLVKLCLRRLKELRGLSLLPPLLTFLALTVISSAYSPEPTLSWGRMRMMMLLLLPLLMAANIKTVVQIRWLISGLCLSTLLSTAVAAWQYATSTGQGLRVHGLFSHYVPYSELLMLAGAVTWGLLLATLQTRHKAACWAMSLLSLAIAATLLITETRAALAALVVAAMFVLWLVTNWKLRVASVVALLVIMVAGSYWFQKTRSGQGWFSRKDPGTDYRLLMWEDGIRLAAEHPWVGIGMDTIVHRGDQLGLRAYKKYPNLKSHFHSSPIQIAAECGLPALAAWLWLMGAYTVLLWRLVKNTAQEPWLVRGLALGVLASMIAFLLTALVHYITGDAEVMILFWLLMGVAIVLQTLQKDNAKRNALPDGQG